jgi:hypothetical protein
VQSKVVKMFLPGHMLWRFYECLLDTRQNGGIDDVGVPYGNRTRVAAVKGRVRHTKVYERIPKDIE